MGEGVGSRSSWGSHPTREREAFRDSSCFWATLDSRDPRVSSRPHGPVLGCPALPSHNRVGRPCRRALGGSLRRHVVPSHWSTPAATNVSTPDTWVCPDAGVSERRPPLRIPVCPLCVQTLFVSIKICLLLVLNFYKLLFYFL